MELSVADCPYEDQEEIISRKCDSVEPNTGVKTNESSDVVYCYLMHEVGIVLSVQGYVFTSGVQCVLCLCVHKPRGCRGNSVTPVSVNLRLSLRTLIGQSLVAVLAEAEDGQHVSPLLPPQRVSFVQRGELAERGERARESEGECRTCTPVRAQSSLLGCHRSHHSHLLCS